MLRRLSSVLLIVVLIVGILSFAACNRVTSGSQGKSILDKVIDTKKLKVGFLPDYAPWGFRNAEGKYVGYDLDIAADLGAALGATVEYVPVEAPNRVPSVATGKVDVVIGCLTPTNERAKTIDFTIPYASAGIVPIAQS